MQIWISRRGLTLPGLAMLNQTHAVTTVTGQITSSLILTSSGLVNGVAGSSGLNFGALNFGTADRLFTDSAHTQILAINGVINQVTSTGVAQSVNLYGKAGGTVGLPAGAHTDAVSVVLSC